MKQIKYIVAALVAVVSINIANAQTAAPAPAPQVFQLGEIVKDPQGNEYKVVLEPVRKTVAVTPQVTAQPAAAPVVAAPAPAPVVYAQPGVVYAQPQQQSSPLGGVVRDVGVAGAKGAGFGAINAAITGGNVGKGALGGAAGFGGAEVIGKVADALIPKR